MENNFHHDDLEAFFRKTFEEQGEAPVPEGWETPSEQVWSGIRKGVAPPAPVNNLWPMLGRFYPFLLVGFLLLLLAACLYKRNQELKAQLEKQEQAIVHLQDSLHTIQAVAEAAPLGKAAIGTARVKKPIVDSPVVQKNHAAAFLPPDKTEPAQRIPQETLAMGGVDARQASHSEKELGNSGRTAARQRPSTSPQKPVAPEGRSSEQVAETLLPMLESRQSMLLPPAGARESLSAAPAIRPGKGRGRFYLGTYVGYNYTSRELTTRMPLLREQETAQGAIELGLRGGYRLSRRLALESGVGVYKVQQRSRQLLRVNHDPGRERATGRDEVEASYALAVPSSYGESEIVVDLRRDQAQNVPAGQPIALEIRSRQELQFVSIPLLLRYSLLDGRFSLGVKGGLAMGFLQSSGLRVRIRTSQPGMRVPATRIRKQFSETRSTHLDYLIGLTARYRISPDFELALEPTYRSNLRPVVEGAGLETRTFTVGAQLGLHYHF